MPRSTDELVLAETAASKGTIPERAQALLDVLRPVVPFDAAWVASADPLGPGYESLASVDLDASTVRFLRGPLMAHDIEVTGTDRSRPPLSPSDLPYPADELPTWAECLTPAGIVEALAVALFSATGQHVGFLALLSGSRQPPTEETRLRLARLARVIAHGVDPMRSLAVAARLVRGATAGVVLLTDGTCRPLPGLAGDPLLVPGSPVVGAVCGRADGGHTYSSFLWPLGGRHAPDGHVRVTVLAVPEDVPVALAAMVLLSPAPDLHGLTPRELEVLGLLVEGCSNQVIASALVVAPRTVAAHLEHILAKLGTSTRTLAAVHAERDGLYIPAPSPVSRA